MNSTFAMLLRDARCASHDLQRGGFVAQDHDAELVSDQLAEMVFQHQPA